MSRINSNIPALQAIHRLQRNHQDLTRGLERLASGLRINRGADDPAGLIASERLRLEIRGIRQAIDNSGRASNVISVAEGALTEASSLLLDLQALILQASNDGGLSKQEVSANQLQIDSILDSLDRISNTTTFAGKKLLDGSQAYVLSGTPPLALPSIRVFSARVAEGGTRDVQVQVIQSALTAAASIVGLNASGPSTTSATTILLRGTEGSELISFASGTTLGQIRDTINNLSLATGVSAVVSAAGGVASALLLNSTTVGSDAFVSVEAIGGNFIANDNNNTTILQRGTDAQVLVDGQLAAVRGLEVTIRSGGLDAEFILTRNFAQTLSSASFSIVGGGALFQITPEVTPNGQINVGFNSVATTSLGNPVTGRLFSLRSGAGNHLTSKKFVAAQRIVADAISQVAFYRGRLGNIQKNLISTNVNSQKVALENVTAAESVIRDADMATEISNLTRAQILVQSTQSTLQIANSIPQFVLSLLG